MIWVSTPSGHVSRGLVPRKRRSYSRGLAEPVYGFMGSLWYSVHSSFGTNSRGSFRVGCSRSLREEQRQKATREAKKKKVGSSGVACSRRNMAHTRLRGHHFDACCMSQRIKLLVFVDSRNTKNTINLVFLPRSMSPSC